MEYGLIGKKLGHSFSKTIHAKIADYSYELLELSETEIHIFLKEKDFKAVNVTIPYKQTVIPYLDEISPAAKSIGAVNCIRNDNGKLIGHNTDFDGLRELITRHRITSLKGETVLILGTGGTSDTAKAVCESLGALEIIKVSRKVVDDQASFEDSSSEGTSCNRSLSKSASGKCKCITYDMAISDFTHASLIINATPAGMYPDIQSQAIKLDKFKNLRGVFDAVYNPLRSQLICSAQELGIEASGGLFMLVLQAIKASEFFLQKTYPGELAETIYRQIALEKTNIVLTGMPASGKSTVGKILASELSKKFVDVDDLIREQAGLEIPEIFSRFGEKHFRDLESQVISEIAKESGLVIATGGGSVLRGENVRNLKLNGMLFFLNRDPKTLIPTEDRPTASSAEKIMKLYRERLSIYESCCDFNIRALTIENTVQTILSSLII